MAGSAGKSIVTDGLVLYFDPFNTRSSRVAATIYDISINAASGSAKGSPQISNNFFVLNNSSAYDLSDFNITIGNYFTIIAWIKFSSFNADNLIFHTGRTSSNINGEALFFVSNSRLTFWDYDSGYGFAPGFFSSVVLNTNQWYHLSFTGDGLAGTYYVNAVPSGATTSSKLVTYKNFGNSIFYDRRDNKSYINGFAGSVKVYNRVLTSGELKQDFESVRGRFGL